ncbi:MAG: response regulator [Azospirillum sp.]|nr:response regulator [Azospirillum sp.]
MSRQAQEAATTATLPKAVGKFGDTETDGCGTILVVDDNALMRKLFVRCLEDGGNILMETGESEAVIDLMREFRPDVVLLDILMPRRSGLDLIQTIRQDPSLSATIVVAVTNLVTPEDKRKLSAAGFDGHIAKPIQPKEFPLKVGAYLKQARRQTVTA